jgi:hypothetical protein
MPDETVQVFTTETGDLFVAAISTGYLGRTWVRHEGKPEDIYSQGKIEPFPVGNQLYAHRELGAQKGRTHITI